MTRRLLHLSNRSIQILAVVAVLMYAVPSWAGGFFEKDGVALRGYDVVAYVTDRNAVKGSAEHKGHYKGSIFHFASKANRDAFAADPAKYAPQYGGFCAFGMAGGYKAATDPAAFTIIDDKLYLNYNRDVQTQWRADTSGFIAKANRNWPRVSSQTEVFD